MGVYVKGMTMPNKCLTCALRFECDYSLGEYGIGYHDFRPKECPLIDVPDDVVALNNSPVEQHTLCQKRNQDKCNAYCDGWSFWEDCYEPS